MGQRRRRPHPTRADQATTRPSNGARSTAIYNGTASPAPTPDQSRPAPTKQPPDPLTEPDLYCDLQWDSVAGAHTRPAPTKQPPDPLTEPDLLRFTMGQRRRRPHPTRADQATTRPSNGARSTAIYNGTASPAPTPDQSRPASTKQPPDPLTEPDLLRFTMGQRRRRPHPTRQPPDPLTEPDLRRFTMGQRRRRPHPTRADQRRPSTLVLQTSYTPP